MKDKNNLKCPACTYSAYSHCLGYRGTYCEPVVCNSCSRIYDVNTEFCGEPEEINQCQHCKTYDYKDWDQEKRPCPKCGAKMEVIGEEWGLQRN